MGMLVVCVFVALLPFCLAALDGKKPITATIDASWKSTSLLLEASEFLASESSEAFWSFVNGVVDERPQTAKEEYNLGVATAKSHLETLQQDLLELALSTRYFSPAVQAFQQLAEERLSSSRAAVKDCNAFVDIAGQLVCTAGDLHKAIDTAVSGSDPTPVYSFDHHYPGWTNNSITAALYGQLGTAACADLHAVLVGAAKSGRVHYVLRHYSKPQPDVPLLRMSGFGVELAVKSTEYKAVDDSEVKETDAGTPGVSEVETEDEVEGFLFGVLKRVHPDSKEQLRKFRAHLVESKNTMAPLKVWQLQDLAFQASQRILQSPPNDALRIMRDLSQNIPMEARSLARTKVSDDLRKEIIRNQQFLEQYGVEPGSSVFFLNGMIIRLDSMDPFKLIQLLHSEAKAMVGLSKLNIESTNQQNLLALNVHPTHTKYGVNMRGEAVQFINNLEKDTEYRRWSPYLQEMLYGVMPGHLRMIKKNIFHVVMCVDPVQPESIRFIAAAQEFMDSSLAVRLGLLLVAGGGAEVDARQHAGVALVRTFKYIQNKNGNRAALRWLSDFYKEHKDDELTAKLVVEDVESDFGEDAVEKIFAADAEEDALRRTSNRFFAKKGLNTLPQLLINGQTVDIAPAQDIQSAVIEACEHQTPSLQRDIYMGEMNDWTNLEEYVYDEEHIKKRYNSVILSSKGTFLNLASSLPESDIDLSKMQSSDLTALLVDRLRYAHTSSGGESAIRPVTSWVVTDLDTAHGRLLARSAVKHAQQSDKHRVAFIHCSSQEDSLVGRALAAASLTQAPHVTAQLAVDLLADGEAAGEARRAKDKLFFLAKGVMGLDVKTFEEGLEREDVKQLLAIQQAFGQRVVKLDEGQSAVVANGRVLGPLPSDKVFVVDDFALLEDFDLGVYASSVADQVKELPILSDQEVSEGHVMSNLMMRVSALLRVLPEHERYKLLELEDVHSAVKLRSEGDEAAYEVSAIVDPLTNSAQRLAPLLMVLQNVTRINLNIYLNPRGKLSQLPVKRFYRYVLEPRVIFNSDGSLGSGSGAVFSDLPEGPLLTLNMDVPQAWMVEAVHSAYDLDNIQLKEVERAVVGQFLLKYIVLEGHCSDRETGSPTRGVQYVLGTPSNPEMVDTIVMANLGYFQLKANPGAWHLRLRSGRSADIYHITETEGVDSGSFAKDVMITVNDFNGKFVQMRISKNKGKEKEDVLEGGGEESTGFWGSLMGGSSSSDPPADEEKDEMINVFSIASGHLYERFLRIMMLSVLKNTKTPVKFWFLQNFLSPQFKDFIPLMAKEYGFQYELVQYKWPHWLHQQTEKQRIIWGYKILFLDVLFPLNVKRIIYVDADQTVRADLKELMDMDLGGAPYGYVPFCNSRTEMDGFRFWKSGYWANHLSGIPYHISALYVVDLKRFRRLAAGDRLRGQYQGLSQDPNSLANLDQDLPNNMVHQVKIKSLPQEWLWCETWCDDASKKSAKTIDLCNNPMTKEPKLVGAMRIVPEWTDYDQEIRLLQERSAGEAVTQGDKQSPSHAHEDL